MDPGVSAATECALKLGGDTIKRHWGYFYSYNDKFEEVTRCVETLDDARKRVQNDVMVAERNAEEIEDEVQHYLKRVDEKIKEYESLLSDGRHEKTRCSFCYFPNNLRLRYWLGRKATKILEEIKADGLSNKKFDKVSYQVGPSMDAAFPNTGYESFASRNKTMVMIMQALEDSTISMIGLYGVGGVGKTTFVKEVANKAREKKLFNWVVTANITRNPDIKKAQGQIAEMLGMRLEEESEILRADRLRKRLKKEKENILIVLDDLWDRLDLNSMGIPCSDDGFGSQQDVKSTADFGYDKMETEKLSANFNKMKTDKLSGDYNKTKKEKSGDHKACKILLISRSKEVLLNQMDVQERSTFSLGVLDNKEAETLLKKVAGINVNSSAFEEKVIEISKMCAGLPIALISFGRALKSKSPSVWEDVCRKIQRQNFTGGQQSIEFSTKLSYNHLKDEELKHVFLQCARMGNDFLVMDLVKFCIGLEILQGVYTIKEAKSRVDVLIEKLSESSLLVKSYSNDCLNMHDIVRDVALSISCKEKHVFFKRNDKLDEWPHGDKLQRYTAIVLHNCDIVELPECINCPRLEVFQMDSKDGSLQIPDDFFKNMIELRVLILTGFNLSCLPFSIKCLTNLNMLCLERCTLGESLSIIGELKKLKILSLSGSNIENLPVDLGQLDKLQLFDLSNCSKLRVIPSNIISRMKSLEEFYLRDDLILWETEEKIQSENASLSELRYLNQLRTLDIHIPSATHFPQNLFFDKLDSYKIFIGEFNLLSVGLFKIPNKYEAVKFLALNLKDGINIHSERWIKMLFKKVEYLLLGELNDVHDVFYQLNVEGFPNLKHLSIVNNFGIQYIINSMERFRPLLAFPKLEYLCLYKLENLEKICDNQLTEASFCRLKIIKIKSCGQLENIFSFSMLRRLTMLETIEASDCDSLKEIIFDERESDTITDVQADNIEFPQLRFLTLQSLPAFFCIYNNDRMYSMSQSLEYQVPNRDLKEITTVAGQVTSACLSLFNGKVSVPKLEWLELSSINIPQIWNDQSLDCFQNLLTLNVSDCGNLKYLLSFSMAGSLVNLQSLLVSGCELMEDIFSAEDAMNIDVFPNLKTMEINCMEKLNTIWQPHIGFHSFYSLDSLIIRECNKLVTIFPSYMGQGFQNLQSLVIADCDSVETIFDLGNTCNETNLHDVSLKGLPKLVNIWKLDADGIHNYNNLQSIVVYESKMLEYLFPLSVASGLEKLETLDVCDCWRMKEIVAWDNVLNEEVVTFRFPQLTTLSLQHLFELRSFYQGTHTLEWPLLKKLSILVCSKLVETINLQAKPIVLATEKVIHNLEYMSLSLKEAEWLQKYVPSVHRMNKLQSLVLSGLKDTEILFWLVQRLPNVDSITLKNCLSEGIWVPTSPVAHEKIGVVVQLKELIFNNVWLLQNIGFEHDLLLQRVERLVVSGCLKLKSLLPSSVSFSYLKYLEVTDCLGLKNLMTSATATTLVQLTVMKVSLCQGIVKIVAEEEKVQAIEFRQLKAIELVSLQSLTCFCSSETCDLKFPSLENLVVSDCPLMETFSKLQSAPNLQKIHVAAAEKDRWYWEGDLNATLQKISTDKVSLGHSKHLKVTKDSTLEEIWRSKAAFPDDYFRNLKTLVVEGITKDSLIPTQILPCLKFLEELEVHNCEAVEVIFDINDIEMKKTKGVVSCLKKLTLSLLPKLKCVWNKNPLGIVSFPNLQEVCVKSCRCLGTLFPLSIARNLVMVKVLKIYWCEKLVEIVGKEDAMELGSTEMFEFTCMSKLILYKLPVLSCFYPGKHHLECPILECLDVSYCPKLKLFNRLQQPLFSVEKVVPSLDYLTLNEENIALLSDELLPEDQLLCKLKALDLSFEDDNNKKDTLPFDFLHKVPSIEKLVVRECFGLMEIFPSQKLQVHEGILAEVKELRLFKLKELESIGLEHQWVKPHTEKLETLDIFRCDRLEKLACSSVSFINLKELEVTGCERMEYLFTFSTAKSLVQLEILDIDDCKSIKEIVKKEDEDDSDEIIFGCLTTLTLKSLERLVRFYSGNATLQFSRLQVATVAECPNMKTFSEGAINAPLFHGIQTSTEDSDNLLGFHNDPNTAIGSLFHQQIYLEYSKDNPKMNSKPAFPDLFGSLKKLDIGGSCKILIVIPSNVLAYLKSLEELNVNNSHAVQAIFDIDDIEAKTPQGIIVSGLKKLALAGLPELKCVWNKNPLGIVSFPNLKEVSVLLCGRLKTLFPSSIATNLGKLKTLQIAACDKLVEIVGKEDALMKDGTNEILFEFTCMSILVLYKLPVLSCFYPGKHHLECPILECLDVSYCPKLKLFTSESHENQKEAVTEGEVQAPIQKPLFSVEKVAPKLKQLALNEEIIIMLSNAHLSLDQLLCKLNGLAVCFEDDNNKKDTLPFDFLRKVPSIELLVVRRCFGLREIFPSQVHDGILPGLKQLALRDVKNLESIGLEQRWVKPYSEKLETLKIYSCNQLEKVVCCSVSFINLKQLEVTACHRMEHLFTFSTAKSLEQLEILDIEGCGSIKEIVKTEDEDDSHEIIFGRLTTLKLDSLQRLVRFYSGNATLIFSCLQTAKVAKCPIMKTFSKGVVDAPMFNGIETSVKDSNDLTFHNDLNTTIQRLFLQQVEKFACNTQPHLEFGGQPHFEEIWLDVVPIPISGNSFNNLKSLIMVECESLSRVFPFYLLRLLCNLKEIQVSNCRSVKAIFDAKDTEADMKPASQLYLPLKKLILNQLPNLEHIWNLKPDEILSFQNLQEVYISNCQSLKSLFSTSLASHLAILDVRNCARLVEIFVEDEATLKGETKQFIFHCLTSLTLWELPELKYFYPGKNLLEWPVLTHLDVYHCLKLKLFTTKHHSDEVADVEDQLGISIDQQAIFSVEKVFPNLVQLSVKKEDAMAILQGQFQVMPSLEHQEITKEDTMLGQGQFGANAAHLLQNLEVLKLMCYHEDDESNIFSSRLLEEIPSIENLEVVCSSFNEIFSSERPDCTKVLSKLKILHLNNLQQLNSIGLEHSWVEPLLKTLETLKVFSCPFLKTLVPSTVSFSNLNSLSVSECHGLVYLFTLSTAKSLGQLTNMSIQNCKAIQEIVSKEGDQESDDEEITFGHLSVLSLESLPSIAGIYSGSSKLKFPSLDQVTLMECPQMKYSYIADLHEFKPHEQI